jgi:uncharacterized protein
MSENNALARFRVFEAATLAAGFAGGVIFWLFAFPAAWLSGSMVGVALLVASGFRTEISAPVRDMAMLLTGIGMGAAITPEMVAGMQRYPLSLLGFALTLALNAVGQYVWLTRFVGWDRGTALFAAAPGALSSVLATAATVKVDMPKVVMVQCTRLFVLVAFLPLLISGGGGVPSFPVKTEVSSPVELLMAGAAGILCAALFRWWGVAAPVLFGGLVGSAALHLGGVVHGGFPPELANLGFVLVGAFIGTRFADIDGAALRRLFAVSMGAFLIGLAICAAGAAIVAFALGYTFGKVMVAFAPGGLEAMVALSAALALDPLFASAHHFARFLAIPLTLPFLVRFARRGERDSEAAE